jgi:phosphate transport system protein
MSVHLQREIERLKKQLLSVSALVEEQVQLAVRALVNRDSELARQIERRDAEIDQREVEVEEECLKMLALYQPVAIDLRLIVSALKINNDLEGIGDMAVNIARKGIALAALPPAEIPFDFDRMGEKVQSMLRDCIAALVNMDMSLAREVCRRDDEVDGMKREARTLAQQLVKRDPARVEFYFNLTAAARNLERIADLATNIAEDVIYMIEGRIVRHTTWET